MKYEELKSLLEQNLSILQISDRTNKSYTSIRYWMKKYGLKPNFKSFKEGYKCKAKMIGSKRYCPVCKTYLSIKEFYSRRKESCSGYCKSCTSKKTTERQRKLKKAMVDYKGGRCQNLNCSCPGGYFRSINALEFHHRDPSKKDFGLSQVRLHKMNDVIKRELDKCDLLCSNCHREIHEEIILQKYKN